MKKPKGTGGGGAGRPRSWDGRAFGWGDEPSPPLPCRMLEPKTLPGLTIAAAWFLRGVPRGKAGEADFLSSLDRPPRATDSPRTGGPRDPRRPRPPNPNHRPTTGLFQGEFQKVRCGTARGLYRPQCTHEEGCSGAIRGRGLPA